MPETKSPTSLRWIDADDWQATAERGQCFTLCDAAGNDIADVYHNNHATVSTTPEQAAAYCRLFAAAPDMAAALRDVLQFFPLPGEGSLDRFERVAEAFRLETGIMAPGKDVPAALNDSMSIEERRARYDAWVAGKVAAGRALIGETAS